MTSEVKAQLIELFDAMHLDMNNPDHKAVIALLVLEYGAKVMLRFSKSFVLAAENTREMVKKQYDSEEKT